MTKKKVRTNQIDTYKNTWVIIEMKPTVHHTHDGDNTDSYTPRYILRNLLNGILIQDLVHYHLLTLLFCTLVTNTHLSP